MTDASVPNTAPVHQSENAKMGMWVFLGGEVVFFVSLITTFVLTRLTNDGYEAQFRSHLSIPVIALNTFVLVTSSYFVVRALEAISHQGSRKAMRNNLLGVLFLGLTFLSGQAFEWITLFRDGVTLENLFGSTFFVVTGIHGAHVFTGVIWLLYLLGINARLTFTKDNHLPIENFGLYWHFVDIVWILLFTIIYLV